MSSLNPRVKAVLGTEGLRVLVEFTTGECGAFDVSKYVGFPVFARLAQPAYVALAQARHGTLEWPGGEDFCPDTVWEEMSPLTSSVTRPPRARSPGESAI